MLLNAVFNHTIYKDWFLPSKDELYLMYTELKAHSIGGFSNDVYQSSSEKDASNAWGYLFLNGASTFDYKTTTRSARACRTFTSTATYALRDIGPAGGYIFYASSGTYYEAAREIGRAHV